MWGRLSFFALMKVLESYGRELYHRTLFEFSGFGGHRDLQNRKPNAYFHVPACFIASALTYALAA
jgi:hypothetical protein